VCLRLYLSALDFLAEPRKARQDSTYVLQQQHQRRLLVVIEFKKFPCDDLSLPVLHSNKQKSVSNTSTSHEVAHRAIIPAFDPGAATVKQLEIAT
jgi:hypothetical protein